MRENQERRQARRQPRGLRRVDEILDAAARVFAEVGYDAATTHAIASHAEMSHGSLYQFFPNKEAIAYALAARYLKQLHEQYEFVFAVQDATLSLSAFLDLLIDPLVVFKADPGFLALFAGSYTSQRLADVACDLSGEVEARIENGITLYAPDLPLEQQRRIATVSIQIVKALLPLATTQNSWVVHEMKAALSGYLEPLVGINRGRLRERSS
jgi:AcrR family transcriptional regulator